MTTQNTTGSEISDFDAGAMHKDYLRERRIERILNGTQPKVRKVRGSKRSRVQQPVVVADDNLDTLEAKTGWTPEAALAMAHEEARERRIFGRTQLYC